MLVLRIVPSSYTSIAMNGRLDRVVTNMLERFAPIVYKIVTYIAFIS